MAFTVGELNIKLNLNTSDFATQFDKVEKLVRDFTAKKQIVEMEIDVSKGIASTKTAIETVSKGVIQIGSAAQTAQTHVSALGRGIQQALSVGAGILLAGSIQAIGTAIAGVIPAAANFEQGLSNVAAVAGGLTDNQLENLRQKALQIGADTSLSASQATQAFEALVSNGIAVDEKFNDIADSTVALSEATGSDLTTAANVATDVIQNFAGAGENLSAVVNGITGVTVAGKFQINDYALALSNGGVAVAGMGVSLTDFNAVIAATSSAFHSGQTAGTAFRTFIERLTPNSQAASDAMQRLGLITKDGTNLFYDANGALKNQSEIFGILTQKFGPLTEQQRAMYAEQIFGAEGANFLTAALNVGSEGLDRYAAQIAKVSAADIAATRLDNFNGAVEQLKGSFETLSITIGTMILPYLTDIVQYGTSVVNTLTSIVGALGGSSEAFNQLSPQAQEVVLAFQDIASGVQDALDTVTTIFSDLYDTIFGYFESISSAAVGWGENTGNSFANGISASISAIIDSISAIGDSLAYWLQPGSPPKVAPDLDVWGLEVGQVYFDAIGQADSSGLLQIGQGIYNSLVSPFKEADYKDITDFTNNVQSIFDGMQSVGTVSDRDAISSVLGTKDAFINALAQLRTTGSVSQETFNSIIAAAGNAGQSVGELAVSYLQLQQAAQLSAKAQDDLVTAQQKLNDIQLQYDEQTKELRDSLEQLRRENEAADISQQIKEQQKLATAVGGDGSIQAAAKRKILELTIKQKLAEKALEFEPRIAAAADEVNLAQRKVDAAKEQESIAQKQYDLIQAQISATKEQNALIKKQIDLLSKKSSGGGGGGSAKNEKPEIDKDKEAQDKYNFSIATTAQKLEILRNKLKDVKVGSAEYYDLLGQIHTQEEKLSKEQEQAAKEAEREQKKKEKAAKGGGGGGIPSVKRPEIPEKQNQRVIDPREAAKNAREQQQNTADSAREGAANARTALNNALQPLNEFKNSVTGVFQSISNAIAPVITSIVNVVRSGVNIIKSIWDEHGAQISEKIAEIWNRVVGIYTTYGVIVGTLITNTLNTITQFFTTHKETIAGILYALWASISNIVSNGLAIVQDILSIALDLIQGNWSGAWEHIKQLATDFLTLIGNGIRDGLAIILSFFGINRDDTAKVWDGLGILLTRATSKFMQDIQTSITVVTIIIEALWTNFSNNIKRVWDELGAKITAFTSQFMGDNKTTIDTKSNEIKGIWDAFIKALTDAWDALKSLIPETAKTAISNAITAIGKLVEDAKIAATNVGTAFVDGLIEGISAGVQRAIDAAKALVNAAIGAANEAQDSHSPSNVMMESGSDYSEGYILGIQEKMKSAMGAVSASVNMVTGITPQQSALVGIGSTGNVTNMYEFNIDARGSDISESRFRSIIRDEVDGLARKGNIRGRN